MKLLTIVELAAKPESELRTLYRQAFKAAAVGKQASEEQRNAVASLPNIRRVMSFKGIHP